MSRYEREIMNAVGLRGTISVAELSSLLNVTDQTIRRIVKPMVERGEIEKVHGAIVATRTLTDPPFLARMAHNKAEKIAIADSVASLIRNGDALAIDTGSTSGYVAQALRRFQDLTIVTNSAFIASTLAMVEGNRVFMAGTQLRSYDGAAFDRSAFDVIASLHVDTAILSASAVDPGRGFLVQEQCEADISTAMMAIAERRIMAVDHSKFGGKRSTVQLPDLIAKDVLVTDTAPGRDFKALLKGLQVRSPDLDARLREWNRPIWRNEMS